MALLIGVGNDLPVTVADATAVRDVLVDPTVSGFDASTTTLLVEEAASRKGIEHAFRDLAAAVGKEGDAVVFLFFSGHGIRSGDDYYLVPHDYDRRIRTNGISDAELRDWLAALNSRRLILMLDCCFAGGLAKADPPPGEPNAVPPKVLDLVEDGDGVVLVGSSQPGQLSWTGKALSVFTECLVDGLRGGAAGDDGSVRILRLLEYLFDEVPKRAAPDDQLPYVGRIQGLSRNFTVALVNNAAKALPSPTSSLDQRLSRADLERLHARAERLLALRAELSDQLDVTTDVLSRHRIKADLLRIEASYGEVLEQIQVLESKLNT